VANGAPANNIFFQQSTSGSSDEVPLSGWMVYSAGAVNNCKSGDAGLVLQACMPFESTDLMLVNCGGIDEVNGAYYRDGANSQFVNVRNPVVVVRYVINNTNGQASWQIQDISAEASGGEAAVLYKNENVTATNSACANCVPCCDWVKECSSSPGDPPQVTPLEYFDPSNPRHNIRYFDNGSSTWSLFDGTTQVATGTSDHYIVVRAGDPAVDSPCDPVYSGVNGAYCLTCVIDQRPLYTNVRHTTTTLGFNVNRREIVTGGVLQYFNNSTDPQVPPFDGWTRAAGQTGDDPLVLSSVIPSCVTWTLL
jgi:hypothetical protein